MLNVMITVLLICVVGLIGLICEEKDNSVEKFSYDYKMNRWIDRCDNLGKLNRELKYLIEERNLVCFDDEDYEYYDKKIEYVKGMIKFYGEVRDI